MRIEVNFSNKASNNQITGKISLPYDSVYIRTLVSSSGKKKDWINKHKTVVKIGKSNEKRPGIMMDFSVIVNITTYRKWEEILAITLNLADEFGVVFPDGPYDPENPLLNGKREISSLPGLKVGRWPNMDHSSFYFGSLDDSIRQLILELGHQSPDQHDRSLWQYSLYRKGNELLTIQDFSICLLELDTELIAALEDAGIEWRDDY